MLYKFKLWFDKYYRWIMGAVALLTVALFFVPYCFQSEPFQTLSLLMFTLDAFDTNFYTYEIIWFVLLGIFLFYLVSIILQAIFSRKIKNISLFFVISNGIFTITQFTFFIVNVSMYRQRTGGLLLYPHFSSYVFFALFLLSLFVYIINLYYKKHTPPNVTLKPRKPSKKERLKQLEDEVKALKETKGDDNAV